MSDAQHANDGAQPANGQDARKADLPPGISLLIGLCCGTALAVFIISARGGYLLGQVAAPLLGLGAMHGLWRGGVRKFFTLDAAILLIAAMLFRPDLINSAVAWVAGAPNLVGNIFVSALVVIAGVAVSSRIGAMLARKLVEGKRIIAGFDRVSGIGLGLAEGAMVTLLICWVSVLVEPQARVLLDYREGDIERPSFRVAAGAVQLTEEINGTTIESFINQSNLVETMPGVRDLVYDIADRERIYLESMNATAVPPFDRVSQR